MRLSNCAERKLTELDCIRLKKYTAAGAFPQLGDLLDDAEQLPSPAIGPDVVTMNTRFAIRELQQQRRHVLVLCYPAHAQPSSECISVLSPAGLALIGLSVGAVARWTGPGGEETAAVIEEILFQPEAGGDYLT